MSMQCQPCGAKKAKKVKKDPLWPMWSSVVSPTEYDIEVQMKGMVMRSNENKECFSTMDVGKVVGLYLAYKSMKERMGLAQRKLDFFKNESKNTLNGIQMKLDEMRKELDVAEKGVDEE